MENINLALAKLFDNYFAAFESFDVQAVMRCYTLPCLLATPDKLLLVNDTQEFEREFNEIFTGLKAADFAKVGWRQPSMQAFNNECATVLVPWHFYNKAGEEFANFTGIYQLAKTGASGLWQIAQVVSHFDVVSFSQPLNFTQQ